MLNKEDAIEIRWKLNGKTRTRYYIFNCKTIDCDRQVKSVNSYCKTHSGLCPRCSSKITIKVAQESNKLRPYEAKFNIFKTKCPETDLIYEDYLLFVGKNCNYCKRVMKWEPFGENNPGFWLDRKDSRLGHIKGNLVVCCGLCNFTKTDRYSYEEFMLLAPILEQIRISREYSK